MARPTLPWRSPLYYVPDAGVDIWIRRLPWYDKPVLAQFYMEDYAFHVVVTNPPQPDELNLPVPFYQVHTWKFRYLADEVTAFPPPE